MACTGVMDDHAIKLRFGKRLRELRKRKNLSQEGLAALAKIDRSYVGSCERGERNVALVNIERLADALQVPAGELMLPPEEDEC